MTVEARRTTQAQRPVLRVRVAKRRGDVATLFFKIPGEQLRYEPLSDECRRRGGINLCRKLTASYK